MASTRLLVDFMTPLEDVVLLSAMAFTGRDKPNRTVTMLVVVPVHEALHPGARCGNVLKRLLRILWTIFQGSEQRFGERIVVGRRTKRPKSDLTFEWTRQSVNMNVAPWASVMKWVNWQATPCAVLARADCLVTMR